MYDQHIWGNHSWACKVCFFWKHFSRRFRTYLCGLSLNPIGASFYLLLAFSSPILYIAKFRIFALHNIWKFLKLVKTLHRRIHRSSKRKVDDPVFALLHFSRGFLECHALQWIASTLIILWSTSSYHISWNYSNKFFLIIQTVLNDK